MYRKQLSTMIAFTGIFFASTAFAECSGSLGRGWASGKGNGEFSMRSTDKSCAIGYANFIDDAAKTRTPATDVALTKAPKSGKISISKSQGVLYIPASGFKGTDRFCTKNTSPKVKGKTLSGCVTVLVN